MAALGWILRSGPLHELAQPALQVRLCSEVGQVGVPSVDKQRRIESQGAVERVDGVGGGLPQPTPDRLRDVAVECVVHLTYSRETTPVVQAREFGAERASLSLSGAVPGFGALYGDGEVPPDQRPVALLAQLLVPHPDRVQEPPDQLWVVVVDGEQRLESLQCAGI